MAQRSQRGIPSGPLDSRMRGLRTTEGDTGEQSMMERYAHQDPGGPGRYMGGEAYTAAGRRAERALRGPKGYKRSDERILEDVCERLIADSHVDPSEVSVQVREGVVTLEGSVPLRSMKHAIEDTAAECFGVTDVDNRLKVRPSGDT